MVENTLSIKAVDFNFYYGSHHALKNINLDVMKNKVMAMIGPSGCGKSTFLRSINRMNDLIEGTQAKGALLFGGMDVNEKSVDVTRLRREVGMVFQKPNPFPKSIFENVAYGLRVNRLFNGRDDLNVKVEQSLREAGLWDEVKDNLNKNAYDLS
ncbi:MAG TPA: ATP-binding cassette domain-containing protein, partial [Candidatus Goldiibacteriota bacterium]|nr:ATP-binding cassette domain-containing protein [Candidatus Goldiibacteriota bacterium]